MFKPVKDYEEAALLYHAGLLWWDSCAPADESWVGEFSTDTNRSYMLRLLKNDTFSVRVEE